MKKIEELKKEVAKYFESYEEYITEYYNYQDCINDIIEDIANQNVDIYTSDLLEWAKDGYNYIEDYVREFGVDSNNFNLLDIIRGGQYLYIEQTLLNNKNNMLEFLSYYILENDGITEIEDEKADEISMIDFNKIDSITELEDKLNEILEN